GESQLAGRNLRRGRGSLGPTRQPDDAGGRAAVVHLGFTKRRPWPRGRRLWRIGRGRRGHQPAAPRNGRNDPGTLPAHAQLQGRPRGRPDLAGNDPVLQYLRAVLTARQHRIPERPGAIGAVTLDKPRRAYAAFGTAT